ncbi:hypothetical protein [Flavobacterium sp. T12S277]|uniref:hypothetical protein n=1 Tax=Flavobacterium sp. T12S277 TaxID=3402752 RepID=UPI003AED2BF1
MKFKNKMSSIDLEAKCWQNAAPEEQERTIIEYALAVLEAETGKIAPNYKGLNQSQRLNVSPFCAALITIVPYLN